MKIVSITEVRQDATNIIRHAQESAEPVLIVQRSKPASYVVGAAQYEALRREAFLLEVRAAEEEIRRGGLTAYDSVAALMASIDAEDASEPADATGARPGPARCTDDGPGYSRVAGPINHGEVG